MNNSRWLSFILSLIVGLVGRGDGLTCSNSEVVNYVVTVYTGDKFLAETGATVYIMFTGTMGNTPIIRLGRTFLQDKSYTFTVQASSVGPLQSITITHDGKDLFSDWYLGHVSVTNEEVVSQYTYVFSCYCWMQWGAGTHTKHLTVDLPVICGGSKDVDSSCNRRFENSHIIYTNGITQKDSGGTCIGNENCVNCNRGFFPAVKCKTKYGKAGYCKMCAVISNCDLEECTTSTDQTCTVCQYTHVNVKGKRAYVIADAGKSCKKACSWRGDSTRCYPGTCSGEGYYENCVCATGFGGVHCEKILADPNLHDELFTLKDSQYVTETPLPNSYLTSWSNIRYPLSLSYKFSSDFQKGGGEKLAFISDSKIGIIGSTVKFELKREETSYRQGCFICNFPQTGKHIPQPLVNQLFTTGWKGGLVTKSNVQACVGADKDNPAKNRFECLGSVTSTQAFSTSLPLQHRDVVIFNAESSNGGYVSVEDFLQATTTRFYLEGKTTSSQFSITMDFIKPHHSCDPPSTCPEDVLSSPNVIMTSSLDVSWDKWVDDDSGISHYVLEVYNVIHIEGQGLRQQGKIMNVKLTEKIFTYQLKQSGVYAVVLSVVDKAENYETARRIVMFDDSSEVSTMHNTRLLVQSAASQTDYLWQHTTESVSLNWTERYINIFHDHNHLLDLVLPSGTSNKYDDNDGSRTIHGTENKQSIVKFTTSYKTDHKGGATFTAVPDDADFTDQVLSETQIISPPLEDGDTLMFWLRAYDIRDEFYEENVTVHIDTSQPVLENLWLTKGDRLNVSVHDIEEFNKLTIEWIAYDDHSGLETVSWRLFDNYTGEDIVHGVQHILQQSGHQTIETCNRKYGNNPRGADCYCTPFVGCYHRHFHVKPGIILEGQEHGGIFHNKVLGVHDSDYYLEVTVTNHAKLTTKLDFKITIDNSPPLGGIVHDGPVGENERDYQISKTLFANWEGFFDKESGVKFYQYIFETSCKEISAFSIDLNKTQATETYSTHGETDIQSDGKYYVTVVAYNPAMAPSSPVCSDGVLVDSSAPQVTEIAILDSRIVGGLVKTDSDVWLVKNDRRRLLFKNPNNECLTKATPVGDISHLPIDKTEDGTTKTVDTSVCVQEKGMPSDFVDKIYIFKQFKLHMNWTGSDPQSGIFDYEIGFASSKNGAASPDIMPFRSTDHHAHVQLFHENINAGRQFYVVIKAINKARNAADKVIGPVTVLSQKPVFNPPIRVIVRQAHLVAEWSDIAFSDMEDKYLKYSFAVGHSGCSEETQQWSVLKAGGGCVISSPPTCTAIAVEKLQFGLHEQHTYFVSVQVENIVGQLTVAVSQPYVHNDELPHAGLVYEVIPSEESQTLETLLLEDSDHQLSTTSLHARWFGFSEDLESVTYKVGLGTTPDRADIVSLVSAGSETQHTFTNLNLNIHQKYYVLVMATNAGGDTMVSSDGVQVIEEHTLISDVVIKDGPVCGSADTINWTPEHYEKVPEQPCVDDIEYQTSTTVYFAHWTRSDKSRSLYPDVYWSLQKKKPKSVNMWDSLREYEHISSAETVSAGGVALEPGHVYRAAIKFCVAKVCSQPVYSDGVTLTAHPPLSDRVVLQHSQTSTASKIYVELVKFYDPDMIDKLEAMSTISRYEWALTDNTHNSRLLEKWTQVNNVKDINSTHISFTITLSGKLKFTECRRLAIRGFNKVGLSTTISAEVKNCHAFDPVLVVPAVVIDALGKDDGKGNTEGVRLEQNAQWFQDDVDYTPYSTMLSAVWPSLRHRDYQWAVMEGKSIEVNTHYKRDSLMTVSDPCTLPRVIKCGQTDKEYINIPFDIKLKHGKHYYVCIYAKETILEPEKWTEILPEVKECSDGIVVDLTKPTGGRVWINKLKHKKYQTSLSEVEVYWNGFSDVDEINPVLHHSGIAQYEIALGSVAGGEDVVSFHSVGLMNHITLHSLHLQNGHTLFATVKAKDFVNKTASSVSDPIIVDNTPPQLTSTQIQFLDRFITSSSEINICWEGVFSDLESGIKSFSVAAGSRPGYDDIISFTDTSNTCTNLVAKNKLLDGYKYYITVKAFNGAGLYKQAVSRPVVIATSAPRPGHVYDGDRTEDKDYITSISDFVAYWDGFIDAHSFISTYKVKVGTCPGCDDHMEEFEYILKTEIDLSDTAPALGVKYYVTVTACNSASLCTTVTSDGVIIDTTPPIKGHVMNGLGSTETQFQASNTFLGAKWYGFEDPQSGLAYYEWRVGTSPGDSDIYGVRRLPLKESAYTTASLPINKLMYITVRAYNKAGLWTEATSRGFEVDITPPVIIMTPYLSEDISSITLSTVISRSSIKIKWEFSDPESSIERQFISMSSHYLGEFQINSIQVPGLLREYIFAQQHFHDGSKYEVKVIACNLAGLCTTAKTADILHDSSAPTIGMFAIQTDHAARLTRHQAGWMTWTNDRLNLAWLGFSDLHSNIHHYIISVGTIPFGKDLNQNEDIVKVSHQTTGADKDDEGFVQTYTVPTKDISGKSSVFVAVWAINKVGLQSNALHGELNLVNGGSLELVRRCDVYSCVGHCVCGSQDKTCNAVQSCTVGEGSTVILVKDVTDLHFTTPTDQQYTSSSTHLAAKWQIQQGGPITRYEVSVGYSNKEMPEGVYNLQTDQIWFNVGLATSAVIALPKGKDLSADIRYSVFVRAWYGYKNYGIFKSDGVAVIVKPARISHQVGRAVKDHINNGQTKDTDFINNSNEVYVSWKDKFKPGLFGLSQYGVYISTHPGGHNVHRAHTASTTDTTWYRVTGLSLNPQHMYYSNVLAYNMAGLMTWDSSDGFFVDKIKPSAGIVNDGRGVHDTDFQSDPKDLSASWHGFSDAGYGIVSYTWCAGDTAEPTECNIHPAEDVGLNTSINKLLTTPLPNAKKIYHKVYAFDAFGHQSSVSVSDGVTIDFTPPEPINVAYLEENLFSNPSFEDDNQTQDPDCNTNVPTSWETDSDSCVKLVSEGSSIARHGNSHVVVSGRIWQTVSTLVQDKQYKVTVHFGYPHDVSNKHPTTHGYIQFGDDKISYNLDPHLCKGICDIGKQSIILWHKFTYIFIAKSTSVKITFGTSSNEMHLAVDHVSLYGVDYIEQSSSEEEDNHISTTSLFLSHWGYLHTVWHFRDKETPIYEYKWAIGKVPGGTQVQDFQSVGKRTHGFASALKLTHNTEVFITVVATNAARLSVVTTSEAIKVDMTPPVITDVNDGQGLDGDFQKSARLYINYRVSDDESGLDYCEWAIGTESGLADIKTFEKMSGLKHYHDIDPLRISSFLMVYSTVRCYNKAGLPAQASTDGMKLIGDGQSNSVLSNSLTVLPAGSDCHTSTHSVRLGWQNSDALVDIKYTQITLENPDETYQNIFPSFLSFNHANLQNLNLHRNTKYTYSLTLVDVLGNGGNTVHGTFITIGDPPSWSDSSKVNVKRSPEGNKVKLSWEGAVTSSSPDIVYELSLGTVHGGADIIRKFTKSTYEELTLPLSQNNDINIYLAIVAIDDCGSSVAHKEHIVISPNN